MAALPANGAITPPLVPIKLNEEFAGWKPDKLLAVRILSGARRMG
jgi:hypothetical protein